MDSWLLYIGNWMYFMETGGDILIPGCVIWLTDDDIWLKSCDKLKTGCDIWKLLVIYC